MNFPGPKKRLLRNKQFAKVVFRSNFYGSRSAIISSAMIACLGGTKVSRTDQFFLDWNFRNSASIPRTTDSDCIAPL